MLESLQPIPLAFWRSASGREPVREWLSELLRDDRRTIGRDIAKVQFGWPVGLPLCRALEQIPVRLQRSPSGGSNLRIRLR